MAFKELITNGILILMLPLVVLWVVCNFIGLLFKWVADVIDNILSEISSWCDRFENN